MNKPVQTEICFTKKEWSEVPETVKQILLKFEAKETARLMRFYINGDLLNNVFMLHHDDIPTDKTNNEA